MFNLRKKKRVGLKSLVQKFVRFRCKKRKNRRGSNFICTILSGNKKPSKKITLSPRASKVEINLIKIDD